MSSDLRPDAPAVRGGASPGATGDRGSSPASAREVVDFWFGVPGSPEWLQQRPEWFRKDAVFDALVEARFGDLLERALHGKLEEESGEQALPLVLLARIIVCDQFPRNVWRGRPKSFALDPIALATARKLVDTVEERSMTPVQRKFVYMPFMHSEDLADQTRCVALFEALAEEASGEVESLDFAVKHRAVIERFGRFPHRNEILGRRSTDEELAFLKEPGSRF